MNEHPKIATSGVQPISEATLARERKERGWTEEGGFPDLAGLGPALSPPPRVEGGKYYKRKKRRRTNRKKRKTHKKRKTKRTKRTNKRSSRGRSRN